LLQVLLANQERNPQPSVVFLLRMSRSSWRSVIAVLYLLHIPSVPRNHLQIKNLTHFFLHTSLLLKVQCICFHFFKQFGVFSAGKA